jgi:hypothetical protein
LKPLLARFRATSRKVGKVKIAQAGVEKLRIIEETTGWAKTPYNILANRRFRPLSHLSAANSTRETYQSMSLTAIGLSTEVISSQSAS